MAPDMKLPTAKPTPSGNFHQPKYCLKGVTVRGSQYLLLPVHEGLCHNGEFPQRPVRPHVGLFYTLKIVGGFYAVRPEVLHKQRRFLGETLFYGL